MTKLILFCPRRSRLFTGEKTQLALLSSSFYGFVWDLKSKTALNLVPPVLGYLGEHMGQNFSLSHPILSYNKQGA